MFRILKISFLLALLSCNIPGISQESTENNSEDVLNPKSRKGFHFGFYIGSYFANKYTANLYDGYGFDFDGNKNNWDNSFMNRKINVEYGGYYSGTVDQISHALGENVIRTDWTFVENDMPQNMKYAPAFLLGLQTRYSIDNKNAILINLNAAKLTINGNFTMYLKPPTGSNQINQSIKTFAIKGGEQRLMIQFGYNRIFGDSDKVNFYMEGGMNITITKFDKNEIMINDLHINLTDSFNQPGYPAYQTKKPIGTGYGLFSGLGVNLNLSPKFTVQFGYNPSYEGINIGENPKLKMQHAIGLRAYYNL